MKKPVIIIGVIALIIFISVSIFIGRYNNLVQLETSVDAHWAQVENQLQRRTDLIPNLVNTVKGYASHEEGIFTEIADARSKLLAASTPQEQINANQGLESALGRLLAISENYPDLKANTSFVRLQDELAGTENRIAVERMRYNESVQLWNQTIRQFPMVLVANMLGKQSKPFFQIEDSAREVPEVNF